MEGLIVTDNDYVAVDCYNINAEIRSCFDPFTQATAILRRAISRCDRELVIVRNFQALKAALGTNYDSVLRMIRTYGIHVAALDSEIFEAIKNSLAVHRSLQYPPALNPSNVNISGHVGKATVIMVGQEINPVYKRFNHWPFYADRGCALFLFDCLREASISPVDVVFTNINHPEQHLEGIHEFAHWVPIVALGNQAKAGLEKLGLCESYRVVRHPQYAFRFKRRVPNYPLALKEASRP